MIYTTRKKYVVLVVSLISLVISLPGMSVAATVQPPAIKALAPILEEVRSPGKIAVEADGTSFFVVDARSEGVLHFNKWGKLVKVIETANSPQAVAIKDSANLLVSTVNYVSLYSKATGLEVANSRLKNGGSDEVFKKANGIALDAGGNIYVADGPDNCVKIYNPSGSRINAIGTCGTSGSTSTTLANPSAVTFEPVSQQIAVADALNGRIQFFDTVNYVLARSYGEVGVGDEPACFGSPQSISFEYSDNGTVLSRMYIADAYKSAVQVIDPSGTTTSPTNVVRPGGFLGYIGCTKVGNTYLCGGDANGQLRLPSEAQFDKVHRRLIVSNASGNLTIYGIDGGLSPVDDTPPAFTFTTPPAVVGSSSLTVGGTVEADAVVVVSVNTGATVGPVTINPDKTWSCTITGLAFGDNIVTAAAKDVALNATTKQATVTFKNSAPAVAFDAIPSITRNSELLVSGTVAAGADVRISVNGGALITPAIGGTSWSVTVGLPLEGANTILVTAFTANSAVATQSKIVIKDSIAPSLVVSAVGEGSSDVSPVPVSSATINISGKVSDLHLVASPTASVTVNGGSSGIQNAVVAQDGTFSVAVQLNSGLNHLTIQASDQAGNLSVLENRYVSYLVTNPALTLSAPTDNTYTKLSSVNLVGTTAGTSLTVKVNGRAPVAQTPAELSSGISLTLDQGLNTIIVVATNVNGSSTMKATVYYDNAAPMLSISSPASDLSTNSSNPVVVSGSFSDSSTTSIVVTVNGVSNPVTFPAAGNYESIVTIGAEGNYNVVVTATDNATNVSTSPRTIIYDVTQPSSLTIAATLLDGTLVPEANYPPRVAGAVEAGCTVAVKSGSTSICNATVVGTSWSCILGSSYPRDVITAEATDAAGNTRSVALSPAMAVDGDINLSGTLTIQDAQYALEIAVGRYPTHPNSQELAKGDVAPVINGKINADGRITIDDAMLIQRKVLGQSSF
jgi:hypothetical protein